MTTDVINDVPRELLERVAIELEHDNDRYMLGRELRKLLATAQPAADGEREAFEVWAASVGYHTERDMFQREKYQSSLTWELWRVWQARAAQPQQAVAVTDISTLKIALAELHKCGVKPGSLPHMVLTNLIDAAHKTGEEE